MFCEKCGAQLDDKAQFCSKCGAKVEIAPPNNSGESREYTNLGQYPNSGEAKQNKSGGGTASFILGIIGLLAWLLPIIGAPVTIVGLILGVKGRKGNRAGLATAGMVLCVVGMVATVVNASIGAYKGANGTLFQSSNASSKFSSAKTSDSSSGKVIFCESVDNDLNPTNIGTTFSAGQFYVKLQTSSSFNTTKINVTIYNENGSSESIVDTSDQQVNQDWNMVALPITLTDAGKYKVVFTNSSSSEKIGEGEVTVQ